MWALRRFPDMTDLMVQIPADWLTRVFLSPRRGSPEDPEVTVAPTAPGPVQYTSLYVTSLGTGDGAVPG